jgi:signal transduction histidine kinase
VRVLLILLVLGFSTQSFAQIDALKTIDSLEQILPRTKDSTQVVVLNQLAELYYNIDMKQSLTYGQNSLDLAKKLVYDRGIQRAHNILRRVHRRLGNYTIAIEYTLQNLPISERLADTLELLDCYTTLGNIYSNMENFTEANFYLKKAVSIGSKINASQLAAILNFYGYAYTKMGKYDSGQFYIQRALLRELKNPQPGYGLSYIYNNLAEIYYLKKEYDKAIEFYSMSSGLSVEKKSEFGMTYTLLGLALVYNDLKQFEKAIALSKQSIELSKKNFFRDRIKEGYRILYEIYKAKKDYQNALDSYIYFHHYQDSIFSEDRMQYIDNLKINYELEKIERENKLLKKDAELKGSQLSQQRTLKWVGIITILFLLAISILLYRNNKQRKKSNSLLKKYSAELEQQVVKRTEELVNTNIELVKQNNQLEQFGYIIAHNLRGPVSRILGLSNLITKQYDPIRDEEIITQLHGSAEELDAIIYDLNGILDIKKGIHTAYSQVDLPARLEKVKSILVDKINESTAVIKQDFQVKTIYAIPAYIESILYNLLSNAIKYRYYDRVPEIEIKTYPENDTVVLIVQDNGIGIDLQKSKAKMFSLYQRFHHHVEGKGLGLFLVKTQVEALSGTIEIESKVNEGTTFIITLPIKPENSVQPS